ncbi:MAG: hypothetical protein IJ697_02240 [Synergistaceae bacterium]|nr:hypothetical protein [Synergistaceae bacterium]
MKRSLALAAVLVLVLTAAAFAQDFGKFSLDVADGWTASQEGPTAVITKNDNTASLSITVAPHEGNSKPALADAFVAEFKNSFAEVGKPVADADGDFSWEMKTANGAVSQANLSADDKDFILIVLTNAEAAPDDIAKMLGSFTQK